MSEQNNPNQKDPNEAPAYVVNQPIEGPNKPVHKRNEEILSSITWAMILIWAGFVFLASNFGWLDAIKLTPNLPEWLNFLGLSTWSLIFLGAGVLIFIESLISTFVPSLRTDKNGNYFLAAIFLGIGLSGVVGWNLIWPFVLIFLGLSALASALIKRKQ
jgi:hypothetical protein